MILLWYLMIWWYDMIWFLFSYSLKVRDSRVTYLGVYASPSFTRLQCSIQCGSHFKAQLGRIPSESTHLVLSLRKFYAQTHPHGLWLSSEALFPSSFMWDPPKGCSRTWKQTSPRKSNITESESEHLRHNRRFFFSNLISEMTTHHFYSIYPKRVDLSASHSQGDRNTQEYEYQEMRTIAGHLRSCLLHKKNKLMGPQKVNWLDN